MFNCGIENKFSLKVFEKKKEEEDFVMIRQSAQLSP